MKPLQKYTAAAGRAAGEVIAAYSTSFGAATRLLGTRHRSHVRNIYALVRVADEIVDGVAEEAGLSLPEREAALDAYEAETYRAVETGFSTDLIIHAFAHTARKAGIDRALIQPFFASMRTDLHAEVFDVDAHDEYVYGSAEVVGLMCLRVFVRDESRSPAELEQLDFGARRLGAAFQDVNFLRDLADDTGRLGRTYLGDQARLTEAQRDRWIASIRAQLADARAAIPLLPRDAQAAVASAAGLFEELANRLEAVDIDELHRRRIRVPDAHKLLIIARAVAQVKRTTRRGD